MKDFNNKVVVITGAATGMGRAYAVAFANQGAILALCDVDKKELNKTIALVNDCSNKKLLSSLFDISNEQETFEFSKKVQQKLGDVDVLINNAGIEGSCEPVWASANESFQRVMAVNYFGVVNGTRAFLPQMRKNNRGVIVNVSSIFGLVGAPNHADYCGSKFAVRGFTEALMAELRESKIQVHLLHPGGINTNIARQQRSLAFKQEFLTTSAEDVAGHLIRSIRKKKLRIVYGNNALKTWLGSRVLSLRLMRNFIWSEMKSVIERQNYT